MMKRISIVGLALCILFLGSMTTASHADTLWYNGDWHVFNTQYYPDDGLANRYQGNLISPSLTARTYDDFAVPAGGWTINTLFSNNINPSDTPSTITGVSYEIRQGMVGTLDYPNPGDGGTVISSGSSANFTVTPTGRYAGDDIFQTYPEQTVAITGLNFFLPEGTYWLSVTPEVSEGSGIPNNTVTIGDNAIGFRGGNSLLSYNGVTPPYLFVDSEYAFGQPVDYSMGIEGTTGGQAPIPPSMLLLASGLLALGAHGFWGRKR